ncbi:hypothetical protein BG003_009037 [Podila horticola]|nr:hypothetical protein BG003_009037 [Podila horticola]
MADTPGATNPFPSPTATDSPREAQDPPSTTTTTTATPANSPTPVTEHRSPAAPTETPSTPSTVYHSASVANSGSSTSTAHLRDASTSAPAVSFDQSISSPTPTRPRRPSTPGTQLTHSSNYSSESDHGEHDTHGAKGHDDDHGAVKVEEEDGGVRRLKDSLLRLAGNGEDGEVNRLNSLTPHPGRFTRPKVLSSIPVSTTSSPSGSNLNAVSDGKNKSTEIIRLPNGKSSRQDKHWPPESWQVLDNKFDSEPPQFPGRFRRYFGRSVSAERVPDMSSSGSPSRSRSGSGSEMSFTISSLPAFKSMLSGLSGSPGLSSLPASRLMQMSDSLSPVPESLPSSLIARAKIQDTASSSLLTSGSRLVNTNDCPSGESTSLDKLSGLFKSASVKKSRIPRPISHPSQIRPEIMGLQSPTDFMQSPCTTALYGKRSLPSVTGSLLRLRSRSLSPLVPVQTRVASSSPAAGQPKEKKKKLDPDAEEH